MAVTSSDKLLLGAATLLAIASAVVFGTLTVRDAHAPSGPLATVKLADTGYTPVTSELAPVKTDTWNPPAAQARGRDWIFDTFTPPEIFYNARSRQFTVKPPSGVQEDQPEEAFGLELVAVRPEPFRLQLIGYVGEDGNWRGTFENVLSGEVFLAAAGRRVPNLALTIKSLDVQPQPIALPQSMTTQQRVAVAVIHDDKTGKDVTLTHRERHLTGTVSAFVAAPGESTTREVRTGDSFKLGDATYKIDAVRLTPPAIDVTKESPNLSQPDRRTLTPRETDAGDAGDAPQS